MKNIFFILFFVPSVIFSQSNRHQQKYNNILELINQNELELAKQESYKLLKKSKDWKKPHLLLSQIHWIEKEFDKSEVEYFKYYNIDSPKRNGAYQFALRCYEEGLYQKALNYFIIANLFITDIHLDSLFSKELNHFVNNCKYAINAIENPVDFKYVNMGKNINTENAEYLPFVSVDASTFIFTRLIQESEKVFQEDFYLSKNINGEWSLSSAMHINTNLNEGSICISPNKKYLIYTACNRPDTEGRCDLYLCKKEIDGNWGSPINLSSINTRFWESQACFSPDMKYLYFVSDRRGGYGGDDIWRSEITNFGFSAPENLGPKINTIYDEMSPFLHADNLTFYFASQGHVGMGDFDLFVSKREHSDTSWNAPQNMGYPINSHNTENSLVVSKDGLTAYFVSDKSGFGQEDIFSFQLPKDKSAIRISDLEMDILTSEKGREIILHNVLFETDSYMLVKTSLIELNHLFNYLKKNPKIKIHIEGHTDNVGEEAYNIILSENRAKQVYSYLIEKGLSSTRLSYKGYGELKPISTNNTEKGREQNRRTSFVITP